VILLEDKPFQAAKIGDSDLVDVGEFVVAIGSPFGLEHSVSYGIISAKNRHDLELGPQGVKYQDFFQTDASINPGNSGGPLFNLSGDVIGINTAIASNSGGSDGIGFSIPINMAMRIVTDLIDYGYVRRGFLGVSLSNDFDGEKAMRLGLDQAYGAEVSAVNPNSPAAKAQIQVGDVVLKVGTKKVASDSHLVTLISLAPIGSQEKLSIVRQGKTMELPVTIEQR
jgi:serine protease Do